MTRFRELAEQRIASRQPEVVAQREAEQQRRRKWEQQFTRLVESFQRQEDVEHATRGTGWTEDVTRQKIEMLRKFLHLVTNMPEDQELFHRVIGVLSEVSYPWRSRIKYWSQLSQDELDELERKYTINPEDEILDGLYFDYNPVDPIGDRKTNFLYNDLFFNQNRKFRHSLDKSIGNFPAFAQWAAARALLYGYDRVRSYEFQEEVKVTWADQWWERYSGPHAIWSEGVSMADTLEEYYPDSSRPGEKDAKRFVRELGGLNLADPQEFLSQAYEYVPGLQEVTGDILQTYADVVRVERTTLTPEEEAESDLGCLPDDPTGGMDLWGLDLDDVENRIVGAYMTSPNSTRVAKAFRKRRKDVDAVLRRNGVLGQRGGAMLPRDYREDDDIFNPQRGTGVKGVKKAKNGFSVVIRKKYYGYYPTIEEAEQKATEVYRELEAEEGAA